ncbi:hypothetical protein PFFCH_03261 [Plasmodium falciparum FCH/4]|uniref:Surface antigen n=1 Tax=Plasmodium falciparum FCH/4 TaxID=1036724 RepID=A0A024VLI2_PLAFA|nr:hypothetical protein PFFCH_03261 [Plasmodium falciparum FCH/4]
MKRVMQQFHDRTTQRFQEYDEKLQEKRQICKDKCDKEIQKIILKDKLEKELTEKLATLEANINTKDLPICECEKSLADKVEKGCLRCGSVFGGGVAPSVGILGGIGQLGLDVWKAAAIKTATKEAISEATKAATQAGIDAVKLKIKEFLLAFPGDRGLVDLLPIVNESTFNNGPALFKSAEKLINDYNIIKGIRETTSFQNTALRSPGPYYVGDFGKIGATTYDTTFASQKPLLEAAKVGAVEAKYGVWQTANIAPVVAVVVIVLIMVIIYLILRYRRKKKMKKKLQYIKFLEE